MNIVIIEDEVQAAFDLQASVGALRPGWTVAGLIDSVESGLEWFAEHPSPDLIFSDIQLGDGLAFDLFQQVKLNCPVIFCTAYDEYAIRAFRHNGIDYLLKPVEERDLRQSLDKFDSITNPWESSLGEEMLARLRREILGVFPSYKSSFLVSYREKLIPVPVGEISFFRIGEDSAELHTRDGRQFRIPESLDEVESLLDPRQFYRANRQVLLAFAAIREVELYFERKLLVHLKYSGAEPVQVSKAKSGDFLRWMEKR